MPRPTIDIDIVRAFSWTAKPHRQAAAAQKRKPMGFSITTLHVWSTRTEEEMRATHRSVHDRRWFVRRLL